MTALMPFDNESIVTLEKNIQHLPTIQENLNRLVEGYKAALEKLRFEKSLSLSQLNTDLAQIEEKRKVTLSHLENQFNKKTFFHYFLRDYTGVFEDKSKSCLRKSLASGALTLACAIPIFLLKMPIAVLAGVVGLGMSVAIFFITQQSKYKNLAENINNVLVSSRDAFTQGEINAIVDKDTAIKKNYKNFERDQQKGYEKNRRSIEEASNNQKTDLKAIHAEIFTLEDMKEQAYLEFINQTFSNHLNEQRKKLAAITALFDQYPETANFYTTKLENLNTSGKRIPLPFLRVGEGVLEVSGNEKTLVYFPYSIRFINQSNLVFSCGNANEIKKAIDVSHNIIARTLLSVPAAKIKLTLFDPIGLGGNFAPFTPLHEDIYGGKIWVEPQHIEQQLQNLALSMEHVIQNLLQDDFKDVAAYNAKYQSLKEPNRLLVIYNFPMGFNEGMINRLMSIMQNGPKTGLNVILVADKNRKMPYGTDLSKLEKLDNTQVLPAWDTASYAYDKDLPFREMVKFNNEQLKKAEEESLNYQDYMLPTEEWWTKSSADKVDIPIGKQRGESEQSFVFDNEDKASALLIGKPGSGKSNLLHVLITNAFVHYSPDDVEFYLIDFKGGVEFIPYADKKIPHIRTIAIESEREFGLSVIQGLEKELLRRENEFRDKKVNKLSEYRSKYPTLPMPRIILVVDEFQEFFTYQDAIASQSENIFDRIVRKGRAFGVNLILSTQSLSGNSLARSTKDLIAIRLALMCSDNDSRAILADDNPAAKLLIRRGQGIYNTSNGLIEGNHHFQGFYLENKYLYTILDKINAFAATKKWQRNDKQTIFRGDMTAQIEDNEFVAQIQPSDNPKKIRLWLGESTSLENDISCLLTRQSASNLICIGLDDVLAVRLMTSALLSIVFHQKPASAEFYFINGLNPESDVFNTLEDYFEGLPYSIKNVKSNDIETVLAALQVEIQTRLDNPNAVFNNIYLTITGIQRTRKFKIEDWVLSPESAALRYILKEGADVGVFVLIYCDSMSSLDKCLEKKVLSDINHRLALQMNANDSDGFIQSSNASKLGKERAYYYNDTEGGYKKVRPYQLPKTSWLLKKQHQISS